MTRFLPNAFVSLAIRRSPTNLRGVDLGKQETIRIYPHPTTRGESHIRWGLDVEIVFHCVWAPYQLGGILWLRGVKEEAKNGHELLNQLHKRFKGK